MIATVSTANASREYHKERRMTPQNFFRDIPVELPEELLTTLHSSDGLRIQRIVSSGHHSPPGFWYDEAEGEWVLVIQGSATIQFETDLQPVELRPGSYLNIPAHTRHRVVSTGPGENTIWLAVYYRL
jgi:cupin 2 domain-containing protein